MLQMLWSQGLNSLQDLEVLYSLREENVRMLLSPGENGLDSLFTEVRKITSTSTKRQKRSQNLAPVLVIISGNSLEFSRKIIASTCFYWCCAPGASAPVVVTNQSPIQGVCGGSGRESQNRRRVADDLETHQPKSSCDRHFGMAKDVMKEVPESHSHAKF